VPLAVCTAWEQNVNALSCVQAGAGGVANPSAGVPPAVLFRDIPDRLIMAVSCPASVTVSAAERWPLVADTGVKDTLIVQEALAASDDPQVVLSTVKSPAVKEFAAEPATAASLIASPLTALEAVSVNWAGCELPPVSWLQKENIDPSEHPETGVAARRVRPPVLPAITESLFDPIANAAKITATSAQITSSRRTRFSLYLDALDSQQGIWVARRKPAIIAAAAHWRKRLARIVFVP